MKSHLLKVTFILVVTSLISCKDDRLTQDEAVENFKNAITPMPERDTVSDDSTISKELKEIVATDVDGNGYSSVMIGEYEWMAQNLRTTKFKNGDEIPQVKTKEEWKRAASQSKPAWCFYNNDPGLGERYGVIYNWFAIKDPRGIAPIGWHISTSIEWSVLSDSLKLSAKQLKARKEWASNGNGTNVKSFTALPGGYRFDDGTFIDKNERGYWWCQGGNQALGPVYRSMAFNSSEVSQFHCNKGNGMYVRCVKD